MIIREETLLDKASIRAVELAAFPGQGEANLVDQLRSDGDTIFSLVAVEQDKVVGHVAFSRIRASFKALALGPVAVLPERQRQGIGQKLIRDGLNRARKARWDIIFVLGDPNYYRKFGFDPASALKFDSSYAGPYFMALPLCADVRRSTACFSRCLEYPEAFKLVD